MTSYMDRSAGGPGTSDTLSAELDHPLRTMLGAERVSSIRQISAPLHFPALCPSTVSRNTTEFYLRFLPLFLLSRPSYPACRFLLHTSCRSSPHPLPAACRHTAVRETLLLTDTAHKSALLCCRFSSVYIFLHLSRSHTHRTPALHLPPRPTARRCGKLLLPVLR